MSGSLIFYQIMKDEKEIPAEPKSVASAVATTPKRRYRYIGPPTMTLVLPNFGPEINPNTIDDNMLDVYLKRYPQLSKLFEKAG